MDGVIIMANTKPIGVAYEDQNIINADIVQAQSIATTGTIGYAAGAYDTITQTNNKTTGVTINTPSGQIITANSQLAPSAQAVFVVTCSAVSSKDVVIISPSTGGTVGAYNIFVAAIGDGSFTIVIKNSTNNAYSEAIHLNYAIFHTQS
jgi:hypothetical protein